MKFKPFLLLLVILLLSQTVSFSQDGKVRIATYNILNYPEDYVVRNPLYDLILDQIEPDIIVCQEVASQFGMNEFRNNVLGADYSSGSYFVNPNLTANVIYYKDSLFTLYDQYVISTNLRDISVYKLYHNFSFDSLYIYTAHLKASSGSTNEQKRLQEVTLLRNFTDNLPEGTNYILAGDLNVYRSSEPAYQKLLDQSTTGYFLDPIDTPGTWNNSIYANVHTQSTRTSGGSGAGGGLDDRFDFILVSQAVIDSGGIIYNDGSYNEFGNDGMHYNQAINTPPFTIITQQTANALHDASDHLPVYADFYFDVPTSVNEIISQQPEEFKLYQNYPNPFNPSTKISWQAPVGSHQTLKVYDILGNEVATLVDEYKPAGTYNVTFTSESTNLDLVSGIYFCQLKTGTFIQTRKMILVK